MAFVAPTGNLTVASTAVGGDDFTMSATVTAGNFLAVWVRCGQAGRTITVTNDVGSTATAVGTEVVNTLAGRWFYFENCGAATLVHITVSGAATNLYVTVIEESGILTSGAVDQFGKNTGTSTDPSATCAGATAQADEVIFCGAWTSSARTYTLTGSFTNLTRSTTVAGDIRNASCRKTLSAIGTETGSFTISSSNAWACAVFTAKLASAPVPPTGTEVDLYVTCQSGTDGTPLTVALLDTATKGSGGSWAVAPDPLTALMVRSGEDLGALLTTIQVDSVDYDGDEGALVWEYDHSIIDDDFANRTAIGNFAQVSMGFLFKTTNDGSTQTNLD